MFKVGNKETRTMSVTCLCEDFIINFEHTSYLFLEFFIGDFEQVNVIMLVALENGSYCWGT